MIDMNQLIVSEKKTSMSFFDALSQYISAASIEIQTALEETGTDNNVALF